MRDLREQSWIASMPLGFAALEREAGEFFLRSRAFTFPGLKIAEIFGIQDGPLYEEIRRNILHINGADHARLRGLVNPPFTPHPPHRKRRPPGPAARPRHPRFPPARDRARGAGHARLPRRVVRAAASPS